jgi:multicomponent Na+:H+ antiporter subunit G
VIAIAIFFFLLLTAPVGAHILGRASYLSGIKPWEKTERDELAGCYNDDTHTLENEPLVNPLDSVDLLDNVRPVVRPDSS